MTTRVLIVDDSPTARAALQAGIAQEPALQVVGEAADGRSATRLLSKLSPDIVTMDLFLRSENGLQVARSMMQSRPTPIVIVTATDPQNPELLFRAIQAGVLEVRAKLPAVSHPDYARQCRQLTRTLLTLASVPVVRRRGRPPVDTPLAAPAPRVPVRSAAAVQTPALSTTRRAGGPLLIGASTGGPPVVAKLLGALPRPLPVPVLLVQHIADGFSRNFADWLAQDSGHPVQRVESPLALCAGQIYVASEGRHLTLHADGKVRADPGPPRDYHRPSVDVLFESVASAGYAERAVALLLTGMGRDGAQGLARLRSMGSLTLVQAPATCAVASMPQQAIALDAAVAVLDPADMPAALLSQLGRYDAGAR